MKRNTILMSAVLMALGCAGAASAQDQQQCAKEAMQLKTQIDQSNVADSDRARMEDSLSEAQSADVARCGQIVSRVKRELGSGADAGSDDYSSSSTQDSAGEPTAGASDDAENGYAAGHAAADEALPDQPGGSDYGQQSAADTTMQDEGYASAQQTMQNQPSTQAQTQAPSGAGAAANAMLATLSTDDVVDKPVKTPNGEKVGEVEQIVVEKDATAENAHGYAVIGYGGLLGIGKNQVVMDLDQLQLTADGAIQVPATDEDDFAAYPKYEKDQYQAYRGELARLL